MAKKALVPRPKSHSPIVTLQQKLNPISAQLYIARPNALIIHTLTQLTIRAVRI